MTTIEIKKAFESWKRNKRSVIGDNTIKGLQFDSYTHLDRDYLNVNDGDYEEAYELWSEIKKYC